MNDREVVKLSRFLSGVLRHNPGKIGITLDKNGWVEVSKLLQGFKERGREVTIEDIEFIVENNNKKRFEFSEDKGSIRACQGHSIDIDLDLSPIFPPEILYHGTAIQTVKYIQSGGIERMSRDFVHLSADFETAIKVGQRHGKPIVLEIDAKKMYENGMTFYVSNNGVWLTDFVPKDYITFEKRRNIFL